MGVIERRAAREPISPSPKGASHDITIHQELDAIEEWLQQQRHIARYS